MLSKLEKNKWFIELLRSTVSAIVVTLVAGVFMYSAIINRLGALEKADSPNRLEFDILTGKVGEVDSKFVNYVQRYEVEALQTTLGRIENNLNVLSKTMVRLEKDVAVITATYEKKTSKPKPRYDVLAD